MQIAKQKNENALLWRPYSWSLHYHHHWPWKRKKKRPQFRTSLSGRRIHEGTIPKLLFSKVNKPRPNRNSFSKMRITKLLTLKVLTNSSYSKYLEEEHSEKSCSAKRKELSNTMPSNLWERKIWLKSNICKRLKPKEHCWKKSITPF